MTIIVGLTGGIATGKSTVSRMFKDQSVPVIDADKIARQVCEIGEPAYDKIVTTFGSEIILTTGHLNRKKLGKMVFEDNKKLKKLNGIVHPEVKKVIREEIKRHKVFKTPFIVLDVPLLFESRFNLLCDVIVVVFTNEKTQLERLKKRDHFNEEDAKKRMAAQMSIKEKLSLSNFKIDNSLSILETRKQFDTFMKRIKTPESFQKKVSHKQQ